MPRNLNWQQVLRLLDQNEGHELPLNFSLTIDNYDYHSSSTLQHMVRSAIHALRSCGWDVNASENFASRSTSYFFNHRDPQAHARAVLRAAGHPDDTLVHHRQRTYPDITHTRYEDEPMDESNMFTRALQRHRERREARRSRDLDLTPGTIAAVFDPSALQPAPVSNLNNFVTEQVRQMAQQFGLPSSFLESVKTVPTPPPPKPKPLPVHTPCGIRRIHRATPPLTAGKA